MKTTFLKLRIKQLFCKHDFRSGNYATIFTCSKCGKLYFLGGKNHKKLWRFFQ